MIRALFLFVVLFPLAANAYVGPAIAGIFGSAIGLGGIIVISIVFVVAWPLAKLFLAFKKKKKVEKADSGNEEA